MDLLAESRIEDCRRHDESGAGFHFAPRHAQTRAEEATPHWAASRHTETPEGNIVRLEPLGVSAAT